MQQLKISSELQAMYCRTLGTIGTIELAGAHAPKFLTAGAPGHNRIYGAPVKKYKD